jgi:hypothetical protein
VLRLFAPAFDPETIRLKRPKSRTRYFARGELTRRCLDALREAGSAPLKTDEIIDQVVVGKGFDAGDRVLRDAIRHQVAACLRAIRRRAVVEQIGLGRGVR